MKPPTLNAARRSAFLIVMTFLANLYLAAFAVDTFITVGLTLYSAISGAGTDFSSSTFPALGVFLLSLLMLPVLLFVPQLPKLVLLPLSLFAIWVGLGAFPFTPVSETANVVYVFTTGQVLLTFWAFFINKVRTGEYWISAHHLPRPGHLVLRTVAATIAFIVLTPLFISIMGFMAIASTFESQTRHYIDFTTTGMNIKERIFANGDTRVYLIGMMHLGESDAYNTLFTGFPAHALVLAEGVTDSKGLLTGNLSYQGVAKLLGLEQQPAVRQIIGNESTINSPVSRGQTPSQTIYNEKEDAPAILNADRDISDFSKPTIAFLDAIIKIYESTSVAQAAKQFISLSERFSEQDMEVVMNDIIYKRNDRVLAALDAHMGDYGTIIIPWGAMHMPDLQNGLTDRGFSMSQDRDIPLIRYKTFFAQVKKAVVTLIT